MKRVRDCFRAKVIPEAKLILVAMTAGRLQQATIHELSDLLDLDISEVTQGMDSLRIARLNVSKTRGVCVLAPEWLPEQGKEKADGEEEPVSRRSGEVVGEGPGSVHRGPSAPPGDHAN